jgi:hypothetical protein
MLEIIKPDNYLYTFNHIPKDTSQSNNPMPSPSVSLYALGSGLAVRTFTSLRAMLSNLSRVLCGYKHYRSGIYPQLYPHQ